MKRTALSLALVFFVAPALAQGAKNDYEKAPRNYAEDVQKKVATAMDDRRNCLLKVGLVETRDFKVRSATKVSVRDGAWTTENKSAVAKCLDGAD